MFRLAAAPRYRLARAPLNQAFVEVRYPVQAALATIEGVAPIQQQLGAIFPYLTQQQVQQVSMLIGPTAPVAEAESAPVESAPAPSPTATAPAENGSAESAPGEEERGQRAEQSDCQPGLG